MHREACYQGLAQREGDKGYVGAMSLGDSDLGVLRGRDPAPPAVQAGVSRGDRRNDAVRAWLAALLGTAVADMPDVEDDDRAWAALTSLMSTVRRS